MLVGSAGKGILEKEGDKPLIPSSTMLAYVLRLRVCGRRSQAVSGDIIIQHGGCESLDSCS